MFKLLYALLEKLTAGLAKRVLVGAGLGVATGMITLTVINYYIGKIQAQAGALGDMAAILHLGGLDTAISIIIGACVVRASLVSAKLSIVRAGK